MSNCCIPARNVSQRTDHFEVTATDTIYHAGELPALRDDSIWIGGFQNIVHHLQQKQEVQWDLDQVCSSRDRADIAAYISIVSVTLLT